MTEAGSVLAVLADAEGVDMCTLDELVRDLPGVRVERGGDARVRHVRVHAALVERGDLFVAIPGEKVDGLRFAPEALERGAVGVVTRPGADVPFDAAWIVADDPRVAAALLSARAWDNPATRLDAVGFTATNGKTTATFLLRSIAEACGRRPAVLGTLGAFLPNGPRPQDRTTPEAPELQATLADALEQGADLAVMEVSSHSLDLHRVDGIPFAVAAFLNLSPEHLDWHGTMDAYAASKERLFSELLAPGRTSAGRPRTVLNKLDPWADRFRRVVDDAIFFAISDDGADVTARGLRIDPDGTRFDLVTPDGSAPVALMLPGEHNVENALGAASVAWALGMPTDGIAAGLSAAQAPPGRFELVHHGTFDAYVDYAHTEDGLERVLEVARRITRGRLIVVLGCGGDRDPSKRSGMGRIAAALADRAIFTADNPRNEDPGEIVAQMLSGVADSGRVETILDRRAALERAVASAGPGDMVLATGKGHETYQEIAGTKYDFPEREILARIARECDGEAE